VLLAIALTGLGFYILGFVWLYAFQERLVYFPTSTLVATPAAIGLEFEDVRFRTEDGLTLHGWFVPHPTARHTVLFLHGNAGNVSHRLQTIDLLHELGLAVFIFDYRGYGHSEGRPGEQGTYRDAEAAWSYLTGTRDIPPERIVVFGRSLGGAVAAWLAVRHPPAAVVLESTFASGEAMARRTAPIYPAGLLTRLRYDSIGRVPALRAPLLVIHSRDDEIVPLAQARALFAAAPQPKAFLEIRGSHNTAFLQDLPRYRAGLRRFLERLEQGGSMAADAATG